MLRIGPTPEDGLPQQNRDAPPSRCSPDRTDSGHCARPLATRLCQTSRFQDRPPAMQRRRRTEHALQVTVRSAQGWESSSSARQASAQPTKAFLEYGDAARTQSLHDTGGNLSRSSRSKQHRICQSVFRRQHAPLGTSSPLLQNLQNARDLVNTAALLRFHLQLAG